MMTYNATVRLAGKLDNEVDKIALTTPEILILRKIHGGDDAVVRVVEAGDWEKTKGVFEDEDPETGEKTMLVREFDDDAERDRLLRIYGDALADENRTGLEVIGAMFGGEYTPLPAELPEFRAKRAAEPKVAARKSQAERAA